MENQTAIFIQTPKPGTHGKSWKEDGLSGFSNVFGRRASSADVFGKMVKPIIHRSVEGYNGLVFIGGEDSIEKKRLAADLFSFSILELFSTMTDGRTYKICFSNFGLTKKAILDPNIGKATLGWSRQNVYYTGTKNFISNPLEIFSIAVSNNFADKDLDAIVWLIEIESVNGESADGLASSLFFLRMDGGIGGIGELEALAKGRVSNREATLFRLINEGLIGNYMSTFIFSLEAVKNDVGLKTIQTASSIPSKKRNVHANQIQQTSIQEDYSNISKLEKELLEFSLHPELSNKTQEEIRKIQLNFVKPSQFQSQLITSVVTTPVIITPVATTPVVTTPVVTTPVVTTPVVTTSVVTTPVVTTSVVTTPAVTTPAQPIPSSLLRPLGQRVAARVPPDYEEILPEFAKSNQGLHENMIVGGVVFHYVRNSPRQGRESYRCKRCHKYICVIVDGPIFFSNFNAREHQMCST